MTLMVISNVTTILICGFVVSVVVRFAKQVVADERQDKRRVEAELLTVIGKTEVVPLVMSDDRPPPPPVRYIDDKAAVELARSSSAAQN